MGQNGPLGLDLELLPTGLGSKVGQNGPFYTTKAFDKIWHDGLMYKLKRLGICGKYYELIHSFLNDRHQRVVLNGQCSNWSNIKADVPQGSILGPLLLLAYVNDLPEGLTTNAKLVADDTSLFSAADDSTLSSVSLNNDLLKISHWAYQWKMIFNPDFSKQAQEVVLSRKGITTNHATVYFNNDPVIRKNFEKHLESKLNFSGHINKTLKVSTLSEKRTCHYYGLLFWQNINHLSGHI